MAIETGKKLMAKWYALYLQVEPKSMSDSIIFEKYQDVIDLEALGVSAKHRYKANFRVAKKPIMHTFTGIGHPWPSDHLKVVVLVLKFKDRDEAIQNKFRLADYLIKPENYGLQVAKDQTI